MTVRFLQDMNLSEFFHQRRSWATGSETSERVALPSVPSGMIPLRLDHEFEWKIMNRCNYRCSYCFFDNMWENETAKDRYFPADEWLRVWLRVFRQHGSVKLVLTGGEPTLYPDFVPLLSILTKYHRVDFDTNLFRSYSWVRNFVHAVDPRHVYMGMSFHPQFSDAQEFGEKARLVHDRGFEYRVHLICYPPAMKNLSSYHETLTDMGLRVLPCPFRGEFEGKQYPQSYSDEEKATLRRMMGPELSEKNQFWIARQLDPIDPFGKLCYAGNRYARIENDGKVWRCNQYLQNAEAPVGNIFDPAFSLDPSPRACGSHQCGCEWWFLVDYYERRHQP